LSSTTGAVRLNASPASCSTRVTSVFFIVLLLSVDWAGIAPFARWSHRFYEK
jgi:hypothetical protein